LTSVIALAGWVLYSQYERVENVCVGHWVVAAGVAAYLLQAQAKGEWPFMKVAGDTPYQPK
jgi:hypothetical protein